MGGVLLIEIIFLVERQLPDSTTVEVWKESLKHSCVCVCVGGG